MAVLFTKIMEEAVKKGILVSNSVNATKWFRDKAQEIPAKDADPNKIIKEDRAELKRSVVVGRMYLFNYDPLTKNDLPYYDRFPLVFPFKKVGGGFLGINMHYLPLDLRAKMMDGLYTIAEDNLEPQTRLKLSYKLLSTASRLRYFKPCVKHYLNSQLKSRFLEIPATQWDLALFLPLDRFEKADKKIIYRDSRRIIKGRN